MSTNAARLTTVTVTTSLPQLSSQSPSQRRATRGFVVHRPTPPPLCAPRPAKLVPEEPPTPPKPTLRDPLTPKTFALMRENQGCHVVAFVNGFYGERAHCRFALVNPQRNPLQMWRSGLRISLSHFVTRTKERAALVLDTLWLSMVPLPS